MFSPFSNEPQKQHRRGRIVPLVPQVTDMLRRTGRYDARRWALVFTGLTAAAWLSYSGSAQSAGNVYENASQPQWAKVAVPRQRAVKQEAGKVVYWVTPGPRRLSADVFGTPKHPKMLFNPKLKAAEKAVAAHKAPPALTDTLKKLPILVGVPLKARHKHADGSWWLDAPTPFGDKGLIIQGSFTAHYYDYVTKNPAGPPAKTPDKATMEAKFTDPQGHHYRVVFKKVLKAPFPGYHVQGGVMIDSYHHGLTGTGSPLMPKVKTYAALWGMGDVYIEGKRADENVVMHMMTTEVVRDRNYHLALNNEMPLPPDRWLVKGQRHHTHLIVLPIKVVHGKGPVFQPLKTAFKLPNGKTQPFMHIMYEEDDLGPVTSLQTGSSNK
jgi:hypothetical protein